MLSTIDNGFFPLVGRRYTRFQIMVMIAFLRNVIVLMTGNIYFPLPIPTLVAFAAALDDLETKALAAMNRGRLEILARRVATTVVLGMARQLGNYVEATANGDLQVLRSSGFEPVRAPSPKRLPATPTNPRFEYTGLTGELLLRFDGDANVKNFSVEYAENPAGPWTDAGLSSATRVVIKKLTPGTTYWGRARANGALGPSDWSVPTCLMAV